MGQQLPSLLSWRACPRGGESAGTPLSLQPAQLLVTFHSQCDLCTPLGVIPVFISEGFSYKLAL